jgi:superfamily I DNA and/or RNA helicase
VDPIALAALQRGGILVLAGDPRQLPPTVLSQEAAVAGLSSTLFERISGRFGSSVTHMLEVQYRMPDALMAFPSSSMYDGRLVAAPGNREHSLSDLPGVKPERPSRPAPWLVLDTSQLPSLEQQSPDGTSYFHPEHAALTAAEVKRLLARGVPPTEVAAITPYQAQVRQLSELLSAELAAGVEIGSVDGFQGREKEAVVVDLVRHNKGQEIGFLRDVRRTNVAITRAKRFLVVIANVQTLNGHQYYRALFEAAERAGAILPAAELP